jgi:hypothetical protein
MGTSRAQMGINSSSLGIEAVYLDSAFFFKKINELILEIEVAVEEVVLS